MTHDGIAEDLLRIDGLHVGFSNTEVVRGIDLRIAPGEVVGLVGESGSGKSMTAVAVMRLLPPGGAVTSGRILFRGQDRRDRSIPELNRLRGSQIGMIFQDPLTALNPALSIGRQLTDAIRSHQPLGRRAAMGACKAVGFITRLLRLRLRRLRGGSRGSDDGKHLRAYRSAPLFARRGRAGPSPCTSASVASCSYAWPRSR